MRCVQQQCSRVSATALQPLHCRMNRSALSTTSAHRGVGHDTCVPHFVSCSLHNQSIDVVSRANCVLACCARTAGDVEHSPTEWI